MLSKFESVRNFTKFKSVTPFESEISFLPLIFTLGRVWDWNSFRVSQNYSDSFRYLYPSQCESFQTNPKNVLYLVWWKTVKSQSDLIRLILRHQSEWIRTNPKPSFQSRSIQINPNESKVGMIRIGSDSHGLMPRN